MKFTVTTSALLALMLAMGITLWEVSDIHRTIAEMNARQKSVVVTQHAAIEAKIAEVCGK